MIAFVRDCITYSEFRPSTKKVCSSDVMHCQIRIFETKMMVKIDVIFMSFSNPTCHFRDTADFTVCTVLYVLYGKSAVSLKWQVGFENEMKITPIISITFSSKMLIRQ